MPAYWLYCWARPTLSVFALTMGSKRSTSLASVFLRKKSVAEVWPPVRMPLASSNVISFTAPTSRVLASGTAASAARFIDSTSSSACLPMPNIRMAFSAFCRLGGSGIFSAALPKKPPPWPRRATAASAPRVSASFNPALMSALESVSTPLAVGWPAGWPTTPFSIPFQSKAWAGKARVRPAARIIQCFMMRPLYRIGLQDFCSIVGQARTLTSLQGDMAVVRPALEMVHHVGEAGTAFGEVGRVDLGNVAQAHHLGAGAGTGDQRLHLLGREVLRLVDDEELVEEGAAAHEVERLHFYPGTDQVLRGSASPFAGIVVALVQYVEVVFQCAHPRRHFLFLGPGQKTDVFADRNGHAGHDDFGVDLLVEHLGQTGGQREQGLAGTGLAEQGDEVDLGIHQYVECIVLLAVARGDAPDVVLLVAEIAHRDHLGLLAFALQHLRVERVGAFLEDELVRQQARDQRPLDAVVGLAVGLPRFHAFAVRVPEIGGQFAQAGVLQSGVFQYLVVEVILGRKPQRARLDAHVDVFRHQNDLAFGVMARQEQHDAEDLVVDLAGRQAQRDVAGDRLGLQKQPAGGGVMAVRCEWHAFLDAVELADDLVEKAAGLASVARYLVHAFFVLVEFLQRGDRHIDVMLFEAVQAGGVVHQHVGIQYEQLGQSRGFSRTVGFDY